MNTVPAASSGRPRAPRLVPAVDRAVRVLRALAADGASPRLSDLSQALGVSKSSLSGLLATLEHHGLVERDAESRVYRLGGALMELGSAAQRELDLARAARRPLERLRDTVGETAVLHVPAGDGAVIVARAESRPRLKVVAPLGHRLPPLAGAVAKVLLAHRPEADLAPLLRGGLPAFTRRSVTDPQRYLEELRRVRRRGYALDDEEYLPGVCALSAPVYDVLGRLAGTVTVVGSSARLSRSRLRAAAREVRAAAREISQRLGAGGAEARLGDAGAAAEASTGRSRGG
ncbi:MAG: IclR family transcriptional regulator [Armatimonadota bacterium]|nr:IclR family transcriptional regulator [Armatimonadota bacterium]